DAHGELVQPALWHHARAQALEDVIRILLAWRHGYLSPSLTYRLPSAAASMRTLKGTLRACSSNSREKRRKARGVPSRWMASISVRLPCLARCRKTLRTPSSLNASSQSEA